MDQNQNNTNMNLNSNQAPVGGMSFVTGESSIPQQNIVNQPVQEQTNIVNPNPVVNNVQPQQVVPQPVENSVSVEQPMNNNMVNQQNIQPVQTMNTVPVQEQPVINTVPNAEPVNVPNVPLQEQPVVNQPVNVQPVQGVNELNNLPPVQPNVVPNNMDNTNGNSDEVKIPKKINPVLAVILVIVLAAAGVALGFFLFNKFGNKGESEPEEQQNIVEENTKLSANIVNNTNVDNNKLVELLNSIGIAPTSDVKNNNNLNYYLTNNNYKENASNIIVNAAVNSDGKTSSEINLPEGYDLKSDIGACSDTVSCALISKDDALKLLKRYNLGDDLSKYFYKSSEIEDVYGIHSDGTLVLAMFNGADAGIVHDLSAEMVDEYNVKITDKQIINYYDDLGSIKSNNLTAIYTFKLLDLGEYSLDNVSVSG